MVHRGTGPGRLERPAAQPARSTITFDNQSGEPATVKLIGPTTQAVDIPNGQQRTVNAGPGEYHIVTRYGGSPERYTYSKGDPFRVEETLTQYSVITITLHKVVGGQYRTRPTSRDEFERAAVAQPSRDPARAGSLDVNRAEPALREALAKPFSLLVVRDRRGGYWVLDLSAIGPVTGTSIALRQDAKVLAGELREMDDPPAGLAEALADMWLALGRNPCDSPLGRVTHVQESRDDGMIVYFCGDNRGVASATHLEGGRPVAGAHRPAALPSTIEGAEVIFQK